MPNKRRPRKGSKAYSPRKRAASQTPRLDSWPEISEGPKLQGFAGYKAGMTHAFVVDYRPKSLTSGQEIQVPVTVLEVPPMKVAAVRVYESTRYGLRTVGEVWSNSLNSELSRRLPIPKNYDPEKAWNDLSKSDIDDVRVLTYTQPKLVSGVPKKVPELMETRIGGGTIEERLEYAKSLLGKEVSVSDFVKDGGIIDVSAITKGKGFQGAVKRWGIKLLHHKNSKHRRLVGNLGPKRPGYVRPTVPQGGQMGYHQRTEFNKRVLKIGEKGEEITPKGGFLNYGDIRNNYVLIHGSVPGPTKRLIRLRDPVRPNGTMLKEAPNITYVSIQSKQGA
ncbi:MAG: 50S ribosomal protein L3 [Methanomassiliicoccaceae archaeon]|jgi:large subunit ribosomal protein L3|nr:50S ribosomal protein L3 [Euryarchaeota archaeon]HOB38325.1 50S ribosomal protein L3 [Methanomassiliicoccaceae archaeon]HQA20464.1 50S ribosomal protein L3 [Methanomassiliicoccaceae archaeon]HQD87506.1 50S ribosomal protein L3 [Methanomassiliicoccaceae archaeon]